MCWWKIVLVFLYLEMSGFSIHCWRTLLSIGFGITVFSFSTWNILCHSIPLSMISDEKPTVNLNCFCPIGKVSFFSVAAFNIFFFVLSFQKFDYDMSSNGCLCFLWFFSRLGFADLLDSVGLCLLLHLAVFSHYSFEYVCKSTLFLLLFWNSSDMNVRSFV